MHQPVPAWFKNTIILCPFLVSGYNVITKAKSQACTFYIHTTFDATDPLLSKLQHRLNCHNREEFCSINKISLYIYIYICICYIASVGNMRVGDA